MKTPGMRESELRQHATCCACKKPIGSSGLPLFWTVKVCRYGIDAQAVTRQQGLAMHLGNAVLAHHMGPDEIMANPVMEEVSLSFCEPCALEQHACSIALTQQTEADSQ